MKNDKEAIPSHPCSRFRRLEGLPAPTSSPLGTLQNWHHAIFHGNGPDHGIKRTVVGKCDVYDGCSFSTRRLKTSIDLANKSRIPVISFFCELSRVFWARILRIFIQWSLSAVTNHYQKKRQCLYQDTIRMIPIMNVSFFHTTVFLAARTEG